jgi:indolepyruvate ferredoxin oxidoreductase beta subunit
MSRLEKDARPVCIAIHALGGQGGGVLVDWIVNMAESAGWMAQSTSVAGVAQRTGATVYYIELLAPQARRADGRLPVMAQMPVPGEVDIVIAAELMEAGRALQRGLVTPGRTTVIASSHRAYSVQEKSSPGNGIADAGAVVSEVRAHARRLICADFQALAVAQGSVISASLFGALAGSGALPFDRQDFEATVRHAGVGVEPSLRAVTAGFELARGPDAVTEPLIHPMTEPMETAPRPLPEQAASPAVQGLLERIRSRFEPALWPMLGEGLQRVIDYQDLAYGAEYLDRLEAIAQADLGSGGLVRGLGVSLEAARWVAVAMSYDDLARVAELKTRASRLARVRREVGAGAGEIVHTEEYFHPRLAELCGALPKRWGAWLQDSPAWRGRVGQWLDKGRRIHSASVRGHVQLRLVALARHWRRGSLRHAQEMAHLNQWLNQMHEALKSDYALAVEVLRCRRLVKGYSDTHARGSSRFDRLMVAAAALTGRPDAAAALKGLREAALNDHTGAELDRAALALGLPR